MKVMTNNSVIDIRIDVNAFECVDQISDSRSQFELSSGLDQSVTHNTICSQFPSINSTPGLINVRRNERPNAYQSSNHYSMNQIDCNKSQTIAISGSSGVSQMRLKSVSLESSDCAKRLKRSRHNFDVKQIDILETIFAESTHYPDGQTIDRLAQQFRTLVNKIQIWFQNRRAKFRRSCITTRCYRLHWFQNKNCFFRNFLNLLIK